jgi:hypothetical protein
MVSSEYWFGARGFYNDVATQSLRFDDGSSAKLTKTPSSDGDRQQWTFSAWVKRSNLVNGVVLGVGTYSKILFSSNTLYVQISNNNTTAHAIQTNRLFRDVSSWYHIVLACDTTQATASNRLKLYINGTEETSFSTDQRSAITQNMSTAITGQFEHRLGIDNGSTDYFDGYIAEANLVDGSQLTPTSFGETKNGVWIPKRYSGSYGTNGFRLEFKNTSVGSGSSSTIGADTSGNDNHFDSSGIVADDCDRTDSPENNHATLNPLQAVVNDNSTKPTLSDGNLVISTSTADYQGFSSTMAIPTEGKYAFKVKMNTESSTQTHRFGVGTSISGNGIATDLAGNASGWHNAYVFAATVPRFDKNLDGAGQVNGSTLSPATDPNDEIEFLVDMDNGTIDTKLNGSAYGTQLTGMPTDKPLFPFATVYESSSGTTTLTFTFDYTPSDSDYLTICSNNLPEPTISPNASTQADDYFNTITYTGNGGTDRAITGVGFQPDFVWIKERNTATSHMIYNVISGANKRLSSNNTNAEATDTDGLESFDADGWTMDAKGSINGNGDTYVAWNWKAGGTAVSNTDGTITSSVSANTDAGFSIVSYTGNGSNPSTVGHSLGKKPDLLIVKSRDDADNWLVGSDTISGWNWYSDYLHLQATSAKMTDANGTGFNSAPTSTVFSVGAYLNGSSENYIAYLFTSIDGYSKIGTYIGNGLSDGTFIYLGFRPAWIMLKRTDTSGADWFIYDAERVTFNVMDKYLASNTSSAEATFTTMDFISNGFKFRTGDSALNASGGTYIYMAFAENPFKYALGR